MKAIVLLLLFVSGAPACATTGTLDDAIAEKGLFGACQYLSLHNAGNDNEVYNALDARIRTLFETQFPVELRMKRVTRANDNGSAVRWGELLTVQWRVKSRSLPAGVSAHSIRRPKLALVVDSPSLTQPDTYIAKGLSASDAHRMLTGKVVSTSSGSKSFWDLMRGVFIDVPALAISSGLINTWAGLQGHVRLDEAVRTLRSVVGQTCDLSHGPARKAQCSAVRALLPREGNAAPPTHLYFQIPHSITDVTGRSCRIVSQGRISLPPADSPAVRVAEVFDGNWRPITDFERVWRF